MTNLETLAVRSGIEQEFLDALGNLRRTSGKTQRALLAAMGLKADNDAEALSAIQDLDRAEWGRPLQPVCVAYASTKPLSLDLTLPADIDAISWELVLEDGTRTTGQAAFNTLALTGQQTLDGRTIERRTLILGDALPWGYHKLTVQPGDAKTLFIVTPGRCWLPPAVNEGRRLWGVAAQLYLLRSATDWGIGDYGDLRQLVEMFAARGADVIGLNPLHAMFLDDPEHASPYSPASRLLLNVLNINIAILSELEDSRSARSLIESDEFQLLLAQCRSAALVDYAGVASLKLRVLERLFDTAKSNPDAPRWQAFNDFRGKADEVLARTCLFQAMREHFAAQPGASADWHAWPREYQDPASPEVARFGQEHHDRVTFCVWLQFLADTQLADAAAAAKGMEVGLYRDLAVGADKSGAETWANQTAVVADANVGAPPDIYYPAGQDWGLPPFNPLTLRQEAYRSFIQLLRANMRHAGGLRIDHVMALQHLYWVPKDLPPSDGAYVSYPLEDLIGILALESHRHQCLIVGEDLGTVPDGFRERMADAGILSYRVLFFEKDEDIFIPPAGYPNLALAIAGSHDMPTLRGWWQADDIDLKERLKLYPDSAGPDNARAEREQDRMQLLDALRREGVLPENATENIDIEQLTRIVHTYLARSTSVLAMVQLDDLTDEADPVNVPSTSDQHPNWRRRLSLMLEELMEHPRVSALTEIFSTARTPHAR